MDPQALAGMSADVSDSSDECESPLLQQLEQLRQQTHSERRRRLLSLEQAASHREQELGMDAEIAEVRAAIVLAAEAVVDDEALRAAPVPSARAAEGPITEDEDDFLSVLETDEGKRPPERFVHELLGDDGEQDASGGGEGAGSAAPSPVADGSG